MREGYMRPATLCGAAGLRPFTTLKRCRRVQSSLAEAGIHGPHDPSRVPTVVHPHDEGFLRNLDVQWSRCIMPSALSFRFDVGRILWRR